MAARLWWAEKRREKWDELMTNLDAFLHAETPAVSRQADTNPFRVLVATIISLRNRDELTDAAANRLFQIADTAETMAVLNEEEIAAAIKPTNFYRTKARRIRAIALRIVNEFNGKVPSEMEALLSFEGIGRKTANLVLTEGFGLPGVCVDTHVHRVTNRLGLVRTRKPIETEEALREVLPMEYWRRINTRLVAFGQRVCRPISPRCSTCPLCSWCKRVGVMRSR